MYMCMYACNFLVWFFGAGAMLLLSRETNMLAKILLSLGYILGLALIHPNYAQDSPADFLNAHNEARSEVGVRNLTWNSTVASYAQNYANKKMDDCELLLSRGPYSENLAWSSGYLSGVQAVSLWVSEKAYYDPNHNTCTDDHQVCGHYTQLVSQDSQHLGCGKVRCKTGGSFICCNYDPPGIFVGRRPYPFEINQTAPTPEAVAPNSVSLLPPFISPNVDAEAVPPNHDFPPFLYPPVIGGVEPNSEDRRKKVGLVAGLIVGPCGLIVGLWIIWLVLRWEKKRRETDYPTFDVPFGDEFENEMGPKKFSYKELANATNNFGEKNKLGVGGFGAVYKGFLRDSNSFVAVKKVSRQSKQGSKEYAAEVKIISRLRHKNTVKLMGWCHDKELILVYEFMPNGSLDFHLFKGKSLLTWDVRYKIVQGLASALLYLHEEGDQCVLHRDIKSSNIMLDSEFNAKLGDFGLARLVDHAKGSQTTALAGTIGYMAPECLTASKASKESDVFSFGIVALEIACGRRSIEQRDEEAQISLVAWVWESYGKKRLADVVDKKLCMNFDQNQIESLMIVGLWCAHPDRNLRPSIRRAMQVLNFESPLPILPCKMPVPNYDVPTAPAISSGSGQSLMSLTVPR
ncbi:hypothetical protein Dsin_031036 [Dipteronia sinensis]|uniref:Protein kinase domain-containing protein n=1 Tax=Dipteronia sinensis TaxID=43782 RepID=A0AAD9ZLR0_9ROSI|nr:hypothetical protein Dsin_031036 [Dipteronia sinensis]